MKKLNTKKGFSLIELLVVIAIIGVLSAVGITAYTGYTASAKEQASRTQFSQIVSLVNAEVAKCSLGSGSYAWTGDCSGGITASTDTSIATYLGSDLGMKNPYSNSENVTTTFTAVADGTTNPAADGRTTVYSNSTSVVIKTDVGDEVLSQTIADAS